MDEVYKPKDVAELFGVTRKTVQRWDEQGLLPAHRTPTNRRYYYKKEVEAFRASYEKKNGNS